MEKEAEKFLQAEETAVKLVETLKQLHTEAISYQTATKELDTVRQRLLNLIESTESIASASHEVIKILKEIGGPEILNRLTKIENKLAEESTQRSKEIEKLNTEIIDELAKLGDKSDEKFDKQSKEIVKLNTLVLNRFAKIENKLAEESTQRSKNMDKLKTLIIVTLASSITAVIIGIIAL